MQEFGFDLEIKIYPGDQYSPLLVGVHIITEKKLPGETDIELMERTMKKTGFALMIGAHHAVKYRQDVVITSLGEEELEILSKNALRELKQMEQMEKERRIPERTPEHQSQKARRR